MVAQSLHFELEDDLWWSTSAVLQSWAGFQVRNGPYGALSSNKPSDGYVTIVFAPEGRDTSPLTESEKASVAWVVENEASIASSLLNSLIKEYPKLQALYGYEGDEKNNYMPDLHRVEEFRQLIGLHAINVHPLEKDGKPYIGFSFGCSWDDEHGLGVLMHGNRTVEIGGADTAILLWLAEEDAAKP